MPYTFHATEPPAFRSDDRKQPQPECARLEDAPSNSVIALPDEEPLAKNAK